MTCELIQYCSQHQATNQKFNFKAAHRLNYTCRSWLKLTQLNGRCDNAGWRRKSSPSLCLCLSVTSCKLRPRLNTWAETVRTRLAVAQTAARPDTPPETTTEGIFGAEPNIRLSNSGDHLSFLITRYVLTTTEHLSPASGGSSSCSPSGLCSTLIYLWSVQREREWRLI